MSVFETNWNLRGQESRARHQWEASIQVMWSCSTNQRPGEQGPPPICLHTSPLHFNTGQNEPDFMKYSNTRTSGRSAPICPGVSLNISWKHPWTNTKNYKIFEDIRHAVLYLTPPCISRLSVLQPRPQSRLQLSEQRLLRLRLPGLQPGDYK